MNKSQLTQELATRLELTRSDAAGILQTFTDVVTEQVVAGEPVVITGFCKFTPKHVPAKPKRKGRNPFTGEEQMFAAKPATTTIRITALKALKDAVAAKKGRRK